jgi:hypothetical protein
MSYVAEGRGGGPHDLLRGFDSFRNCQLIVFMATMVRPKPGGVFTLPFFYLGLFIAFGMRSALLVRFTGIRSNRERSETKQGMLSGCRTWIGFGDKRILIWGLGDPGAIWGWGVERRGLLP